MAYDTARQRLVLFGGQLNGNRLGDTWEWDGANWLLRSNTGPSARFFHTMTYDPIRQRVVLFGGIEFAFKRDTWEWDGNVWVQRSNTGPTARMFSSITFDPIRQKVLLFGGFTGTPQSDTWEWNGTTWTQLVAPGGPSARYSHVMIGDPVRGKVWLFGGLLGAGLFGGDTWEWNGTAWSPVCAVGPPPRYAHQMAFDTSRNLVILYGGFNTNYLSDQWEWAGAGWKAVLGPTPVARRNGTAVFSQLQNQMLIFGGENGGGTLGDSWWYLPPGPPLVAQQPMAAPVSLGQPVSFTIAASGIGPFSCQWRRNGVPLVNGGGISGVNTWTLHIAALGTNDIAAYDCIVTDPCGAVRSNPIAPALVGSPGGCLGDLDGNSSVDAGDVQPFVNTLLGMQPCMPPPLVQQDRTLGGEVGASEVP